MDGPRLHPVLAAGLPIGAVGAAMLGCIGVCVGYPCLTTGVRYGLWLDRCPATDLRLDLEVSASGLLRGQPGGGVRITPNARWLEGEGRDASQSRGTLYRGYEWTVTLKDDQGNGVPGLALGEVVRDPSGLDVRATLPEVPDGDYVLAVDVDAGFEQAVVEAPLKLYAPAIVHLMTDRPLYKPGQEVLLRSVTLRRTDQAPLEGRPGRWRIRDPQGTEMLVEKDRAGPWGVADGSFPLDHDAQIGTWTATWETGEQSDTVQFEVRPFRLPRLTVEAAPSRKWYAIGQLVVLEGRATYTSGAPVANAPVEVTLRPAMGRWPLPIAWEEPRTTRTGPDGRWRLDYGAVPPDLMDRTTLQASVQVVDAAGEAVDTAATVVLSKQSLRVEAVTELGDGLVEGFNNRAYLRVATPDGRPLPDARLTVRRPYDPSDPGKTAETDADGVAALQVDPGAPVTVVIQAPPVRVRPWTVDPPQLVAARELAEGRDPDLAERRALDAVLPAIGRCGIFTTQTVDRVVGVQVDAGGGVRRVVATGDGDPLSDCVVAAARGLRMPPGSARTFRLSWRVPDTREPSLSWSVEPAAGDGSGLEVVLDEASLRARRCLSRGQGIDGADVFALHFAVPAGSSRVEATAFEEAGHGLSAGAVGCLRASLAGLRLPEPVEASVLGLAHGTLSVPRPPGMHTPQPTATTAYELAVSAVAGDELLGEGTVVLPVGQIPPLRMRATPSLATPGTEVTVELLRGPGFQGSLPDDLELRLLEGTIEVAKAKVKEKQATFTIPGDVEGFLHVEWNGARAVVFVQPAAPLAVGLSTDHRTYRPGERGTLTVTTRAGDRPVPAGVGLVGVDQTLGQLAPLLGPDDFGRVTVRATSDRPAFGAFDPRALALGQIRGEHAAKAAVMRLTNLPMDPAGDAPAAATGRREADTGEALTSSFYRALDQTTAKVREWERSAAQGEVMQPALMAQLWGQALADLSSAGEPAVDGYGRPLSLAVVPLDLLALVDPRAVVADATRLPEDVVDWIPYVQREVRP